MFRFSSAQAAAVEYTPGQATEPAGGADASEIHAVRRPIDYARIATQLRDPRTLVELVRATTRPAASARAKYEAPRTPLERELAELWAELLNLPTIGVRDNFFEIGGHSLLAVQLLSRVRQTYGVDLSLEIVYSGEFTVAELAKAIELKEIAREEAGFEDLLAEIGGLTDEEARRMLAEEQG